MTEVKDEFVEENKTVDEEEGIVEDVVIEEMNEVDNSEESAIEALQAQLQEEENKRLRLLADYDNFKRRVSLDQEAMQKYRAQNVVTNLLPVLDNFARALSVEAKTEEVQSIMTGMDMIYRTLLTALETEGLVEIDTVDQEFDPNFHQAIMTGADDTKPSGVILEEMQKGYLLKDRVLRPSMVKVNE
ncbi:nucleotide exchange factor GrpE [Sporosarcina beigongshangi]|uniref:nucleotide exchange factor GrpE n=1 Tax=Sporosarcina beigongshangi TaxID=2782538 RepID=UPI00193AAFE9|nr:nucleotide exchange factor GrpE [Sporosarcina beigongshangi]